MEIPGPVGSRRPKVVCVPWTRRPPEARRPKVTRQRRPWRHLRHLIDARTSDDFSTDQNTRAVRFLGSISQTRVTPAAKYSRTLRAISGRVFPSLSTSTAKSGAG